MEWKKLGINVALAALAAFTAAMAATNFALDKSALIAAGYAALRGAIGAFGQFVQMKRRG